MQTQLLIAILMTVTAFASYLNHRYLKLPTSIGLTLLMLMSSFCFILFDKLGFKTYDFTQAMLSNVDFNQTFMGGMISFLLFAGGLHINAIELAKQKTIIAILATFGVVLSTALTGFALWLIAQLIGIQWPFIYCLLFGALIAPTDPIAVIGMLKKVHAPHTLEMKIAGESLFNDGIGIVIFVTLLEISQGTTAVQHHIIILQFLQQLIGGALIGWILGKGTNWLLNQVNDFSVGALITLGLVTGGYNFAIALGTSGPIAMAIAGLTVGFKLKSGGLSKQTAEQLKRFWELIDEVMNAILFVLIGLAVFQLHFTITSLLLAFTAIPIVLVSRLISVAVPLSIFSIFRRYTRHAIRILTWGGLRGGVSIALALSLPTSAAKDEILVATYAVVVFSLIVQGLTIGPLVKRSLKPKSQ